MNDKDAFNHFVESNAPTGGVSWQQRHCMFLGWTAALAHRDKRVAELEAVVAKLPHTADGKVVTDPTELYWWDGNVLLRGAGAMTELCIFCDPSDTSIEFHPNGGIGDCYSTREAAEAARSK